jgi:hypothetical protein
MVSPSSTPETRPEDGIEITPAMIDAGVAIIWLELTGADLPPFFRADRLAKEVFVAMAAEGCPRHENS